MFGAMMKGIAQDFVRYVMHVQVVRNDAAAAGARRCRTCRQTSSDDARTTSGFRTAAASAVASGEAPAEVAGPTASPTAIPHRPGRGAARRPGRRPSRRPSSRTSGRRRRATRRARAGRARSSRCATAPADARRSTAAMRDFTDDLRELRRRLGEAEVYLRVGESRSRLDRAGGRDGPARPVGRRRAGQGAHRRVRQRPRRRGDLRRAGRRRSTTSRCSTSWPARRTTRSQEPEIDAAIADRRAAASTSSSCAACSPASTTRPTASCRSTPRTAASTPRTGARCCCACTSAGPSGAGFDVRRRRRLRGHRGRASCRPSSRSAAATPTA